MSDLKTIAARGGAFAALAAAALKASSGFAEASQNFTSLADIVAMLKSVGHRIGPGVKRYKIEGPSASLRVRLLRKRRWLNGMSIPTRDALALQRAAEKREAKGLKRARAARRSIEGQLVKSSFFDWVAAHKRYKRRPRAETKLAHEEAWERHERFSKLFADDVPFASLPAA